MKMRLVGFRVQPVVMSDDGENLDEKQVNPIFVRGAEWEAWADGGWRPALEQLRQTIEGPAPATAADSQEAEAPQ